MIEDNKPYIPEEKKAAIDTDVHLPPGSLNAASNPLQKAFKQSDITGNKVSKGGTIAMVIITLLFIFWILRVVQVI